MAPSPPQEDHAPASDATSALLVRFESSEEFRDGFREKIGQGALFLPTIADFRPRQSVDIVLDLAFCSEQVPVPAEIVAIVDPALAKVGQTEPGISVCFRESTSQLRRRLETITGLVLSEPAADGRGERRKKTRTRADADIIIATDDGEFAGTTANISYTGVLALLPMTSIPVGTSVHVHLANPTVELHLTVDGKIIHSRRCDGGMLAHGIQLHYPVERIDEVMAFIEFLQSFDRARRLAVVSGEIDASGLESVLDMFINTAPSGTLQVQHGRDEGKIVFSESYILHCTVGIVSGMKALARMFRWREGRFEFHHDLQLPETPDDPQPFEAAMMVASVQMDEMARIGFDAFGPNDSFRLRTDAVSPPPGSLTELEREVFEYATDGFNVAAIADVIPAPDADIYKALVALLDGGAIERRC